MILVPLHPHRVYPHYFWIPSIYEFASLLKYTDTHQAKKKLNHPMGTFSSRSNTVMHSDFLFQLSCHKHALFMVHLMIYSLYFFINDFAIENGSQPQCGSAYSVPKHQKAVMCLGRKYMCQINFVRQELQHCLAVSSMLIKQQYILNK